MDEGKNNRAVAGEDCRPWNKADRRLTAILDALLLGAVIIEPEQHLIVYANAEAAALIGSTMENMQGQICHQFICPVAVGQCPITDLHQELDHSERCALNRAGEKIPILKTAKKYNSQAATTSWKPSWTSAP
jgi:hypothetical protein